jgi:hypothetical protein
MGVTGGILLASTYCAAEGCGATWSEPQYESVPLTVASEPQIYASPVAGGQTTMLLTTPIDHQTSIPLVDPFPTSSSNNVQILTTPLNQSNATQIQARFLHARKELIRKFLTRIVQNMVIGNQACKDKF